MITVVTGASGHIGANLVRALLDRGRSVRVLAHKNIEALAGLNVEFVPGDIRNPASLSSAFQGADIVYHLAARISISMDERPLLEEINVGGTRNVVEACLRTGVKRLIHFSSIHALVQMPLDVPVDEARPWVAPENSTPYGLSKAESEREVWRGIERGLDAVIINPTAIIGPYDYQPSFFGQVLIALANRKLPALVSAGFDWVDARDVADGAISAELIAPRGGRYLLSGHWVSLCDVGAVVESITGISSPGFVCPLWLARLGVPFIALLSAIGGKPALYTSASIQALSSNVNISHGLAARDLGYHPRPFGETISDTLSWFYLNGQLKYPLVTECADTL